VRDLDTGHYFRVQRSLIDYPNAPSTSSIYEVSFSPSIDNASLIVSYAVNHLRWHARYILETFDNGQNKFQILADIINSSPITYEFNATDLMIGDLNLIFSNGKSASFVVNMPSIENNIDYSGIHVVSHFDHRLTIEPYSLITLPIRSAYIQIRTLYTYNLILTMSIPMSNSLYQLSNSSSYLPAGHLLVYDSPTNVLTGEWHLPTLAESEKYEFELGQDPDIMLVYNRTMSTNHTTNSSVITTYVLLQNYKQKRVNIRFKSGCLSLMTCLFYDDKSRSLGAHLRYNLTLDAHSEVAFTYTAVRLV
jgi:hypothetical protein